mmetsp:Transcript_36469/g.112819  ORF Transcript_36469/g.112819 Transcript_36469/m.112819 type:complete len:305 (+) Transcript_36469:1138-2052(+)
MSESARMTAGAECSADFHAPSDGARVRRGRDSTGPIAAPRRDRGRAQSLKMSGAQAWTSLRRARNTARHAPPSSTPARAPRRRRRKPTVYDLPNDLARRVAAFLFAPPPEASVHIEGPTRSVRREALDATRRAAAVVAACPTADLRRDLRDDLDDAERRRGLGLTVRQAEVWLRQNAYEDAELATPLSAGRRLLEIVTELQDDKCDPKTFEKEIAILYGEEPSSPLVIRHETTLADEVRALLAYGAVPDVQDAKGRTALHHISILMEWLPSVVEPLEEGMVLAVEAMLMDLSDGFQRIGRETRG